MTPAQDLAGLPLPEGEKIQKIYPASCTSHITEGFAQVGDIASHVGYGLLAQGVRQRDGKPGCRWNRCTGDQQGRILPPWWEEGEAKAFEIESQHGGRPKGVKSWAETECVHGHYFKEEKG